MPRPSTSSVDYLVVADAHRRPLHSAENLLGDKLADLADLDADDQAAMLKVLDALVMKHKQAPSPHRRSQLTD